MRPSLERSIHSICRACEGTGSIKSVESVVLDVMRRLAFALRDKRVARVEMAIAPDVAFRLLNHKRDQLVALEQRFEKRVTVRVNDTGRADLIELEAFDQRGGAVDPATCELGKASMSAVASRRPADMVDEDEDEQTVDQAESAAEPTAAAEPEAKAEEEAKPKRRRRRRRRKKSDTAGQDAAGAPDEAAATEQPADTPRATGDSGADEDGKESATKTPSGEGDETTEADEQRSPRRRRKRRRPKKAEDKDDTKDSAGKPEPESAGQREGDPKDKQSAGSPTGKQDEEAGASGKAADQPKRRRRRRRSRSGGSGSTEEGADASSGDASGDKTASSDGSTSRGYSNTLVNAGPRDEQG
jgi:ribonuclease E